jgi:hypothetical protein
MAENLGGTVTIFLKQLRPAALVFEPAAPLSAAQLLTSMTKFDASQYSLTYEKVRTI